MGKAVENAAKAFVTVWAVATGAAFLLSGTAFAQFGAMGAFINGVSTVTLATYAALST